MDRSGDWQKIAALLPTAKRKKFLALLKEKEQAEQAIGRLEIEKKSLVENINELTKRLIDLCKGVNEKNCPHPEARRSGAGGIFCLVCDKMIDYD